MDGLPEHWGTEVAEIERCLLLTTVGWKSATPTGPDVYKVGIVRRVLISSVLAKPWNMGRLERCRRQLAEGTPPPPIKVVGLRRQGFKTLYSVSDGMHRTSAAKEAGHRTIKAEISGWHTCDPSRFVLWRGWLWDTADRPEGFRGVTDDIDPETIPALVGLGVRLIPDNEQLSK